MLKIINRIYLLALISLYAILVFKISGEFLLVIFFTIFSSISYFIILHSYTLKSSKAYSRGSNGLAMKVLLYLFVSIVLENFISYYYRDNFYLFSESDAIFYHESILDIIDMSFLDGISHYLSYMDVDDLGMILIVYPLYHIVQSNLIVNAFYVIVGVITALSIFQLSQNFMIKKYAFLSSLSYSISSFVVYFHATGLKESFMVMLVVLSFDFYYRFLEKRDISYFIVAMVFVLGLLLFRPMILIMIVGSVGLGFILSRRGSIWIKIFAIALFVALLLMSGVLTEKVNVYTTGGIDSLISARESQGSVIGGVYFTYVVNILSQTIGPLPTVIITSEKVGTMFYTSGLIYRILLAFPFWLGVSYIIKTKSTKLYPLLIFILMEMSALAYLMDGLELRKALPQMPIIFIIAFWFLDKYDNKIIEFKKDKKFKQFFYTIMILLVLMIGYWNFR
jgi:hypothetical protein